MSDKTEPTRTLTAGQVVRMCTSCNGLGTEGGKRVSGVCGSCKGSGKEVVDDSPRLKTQEELDLYPSRRISARFGKQGHRFGGSK